MEFVPDWSGLPPELLEQIATCLTLFDDFTAFRGVCTTWRGAVTKNKYQFKVPLLMVADEEGDGCKFYSSSKTKIFARLPLPEVKGKECIDVGFGWIFTTSTIPFGWASDGDEVSLVKPFSSCPKIQLPNPKKFPGYDNEDHEDRNSGDLQQAMLLANPSETTDFTLVLLLSDNLACWRNGDKEWTKLNRVQCGRPHDWGFKNMVFYKGCVYAIDSLGRIWIWTDLTSKGQLILQLESEESRILHTSSTVSLSLVESTDGELLVILRSHCSSHERDIRWGNQFIVMRVDLENRTAQGIKSVGKDAIFVGRYCSAAAIATGDYPGVLRPNSIYFTDDCLFEASCYTGWAYGKDMGICNVEDGSIQRFGNVKLFGRYFVTPQPMWVFLYFHHTDHFVS